MTDTEIDLILSNCDKWETDIDAKTLNDYDPNSDFSKEDQMRQRCDHEAGHAYFYYVYNAGIEHVEFDLRNGDGRMCTTQPRRQTSPLRCTAILCAGEAAEMATDPGNRQREIAAAAKGYADYQAFTAMMAHRNGNFANRSREQKWVYYRCIVNAFARRISNDQQILRPITALSNAMRGVAVDGKITRFDGHGAEAVLSEHGAVTVLELESSPDTCNANG